jgi:hypothetical protein
MVTLWFSISEALACTTISDAFPIWPTGQAPVGPDPSSSGRTEGRRASGR